MSEYSGLQDLGSLIRDLVLQRYVFPRARVVREPAHWQCRTFRECRKFGAHGHSALELL